MDVDAAALTAGPARGSTVRDARARESRARVARLLAPVTVLGPGRRVGLWVQGCALACPGCASRDTWDPAGGADVTVADLVDRIVEAALAHRLDGLTITGGEPTDQGDALASVVAGVRERLPGFDVLVFTGRTLAAARATASALIDGATGVVAGPYRREAPLPGHRLLATANQQLVVAPAASGRYAAWLADADAPRLQVMAAEAGLYLVGLPAPGDLDLFRERMAQRGVELEEVSW